MYRGTTDESPNREQLQQKQSKAIDNNNIISGNNNYQNINQISINQVQSQNSDHQHHDHMQTLADIESYINLEEAKYRPQQGQQQYIDYYDKYTISSTPGDDTTDFGQSKSINPQYQNTNLTPQQQSCSIVDHFVSDKNNTRNNASSNKQQDYNTMSNDREMQIEPNSKTLSPSKSLNARPYVKITEQPARCSLRFRYECEGRSAGSLPGANSSSDNKTYPTIQVMNYSGRAVVVVSCVTKDYPFRPHPHNLVGKEGCKKGICTIVMNGNPDMICSFTSLGIQCVKKKDIEESLHLRETIQVDPFRTGFTHKQLVSNIDLNVVRLCFQVFIEGPDHANCTVPLTPVVSEPIHDKKAMSDLVITKLSHCSAPATGGREVILLCDRISKDDIQIRFYEERNGKILWEKYSEFQPNDVHKQVAICFKTPKYYNEDIQHPVMVRVQLRRPSDNQVSEPRLFQFLPCENDEDIVARKRQKIEKIDLNSYVKENILQQVSPPLPQSQYLLNQPQQQQQTSQHHLQPRLINYHQQQHLTAPPSPSVLQASLVLDPQQANISPAGISGHQHYYPKVSQYNEQVSNNPQIVMSGNTTPSSSPNPFSTPKPTNINLNQTNNQVYSINHHQRRLQVNVNNNNDVTYYHSPQANEVNANNCRSPNCNSTSPEFSPAHTPISGLHHSPSTIQTIEGQDNFMIAIDDNNLHQNPYKHHNLQQPQRQQQHQLQQQNRAVVKHEIIDDEGKIMQIVDRNPQQVPERNQSQMRTQMNRNDTPDTNALSTRLDSLGLDAIDTTLLRDIGFNSALMLNLDSNLCLHLSSGSNIALGPTSNHISGAAQQIVATTSDNGINHTLNTPQMSELDPQPVEIRNNDISQQIIDSNTSS